MEWLLNDCQRGDIIRVKNGSVFHYGIYVSDDEVIQFGLPPSLREKDKENIVVVSTDIETFSCGQFVEVGSFTIKDRKKKFKPEIVVENAKNRLNEGGYDIIHNNCEHFAFECYCGKHYSSQEIETRNKWNKMPFVNVYLSEIPDPIIYEQVYPKEKQKELDFLTDEKTKSQKYQEWIVLRQAISHSTNLMFDDIKFKKNHKGFWTCKECYFSLAHHNNLVVVAISNHPVEVCFGDGNHQYLINNKYKFSLKTDKADYLHFFDTDGYQSRLSRRVEEL